MKKAGRNWKANCPFHHEKTPSFMVSTEKGIFHCFGCSAGGDAFKFVMLADNISWPEAVRKLARRAGITVQEAREDVQKRTEKQKIYDLLEQAADYYHRCLLDLDESSPVRKYVAKRGIAAGTIEKFKIGYAPPKQIIQAAAKKGYTQEQLAAAGILTRTERGSWFEYMGGRLVFPIMDTQGRVVAFGGRTLTGEDPKYLNTPETAVYSKSFHLYGLHQAIPSLRASKARRIMILEGYMDVVVTHQEGLQCTVATLGTALTSQHAAMLSRYADEVVLLFDPDAAGNNAAKRAIESLAETELSVRIASLPDGKDPDEYILERGLDKFEEFVRTKSRSMVEFLSDHAAAAFGAGTPEKKARCIAEILPVAAKIKNSVIRFEWVKFLAERFNTSETAVEEELRKLKKREQREEPRDHAASAKVRSAEEEILQLLLANPQHAGLIGEESFKDGLNRQVLSMIKKGMRADDISSQLEEKDLGWFTELVLEEKTYEKPERALQDMARELLQKDMEQQRRELEKEVIPMLNGQAPMDESKVRLYQDLSRQLKGSVKI